MISFLCRSDLCKIGVPWLHSDENIAKNIDEDSGDVTPSNGDVKKIMLKTEWVWIMNGTWSKFEGNSLL